MSSRGRPWLVRFLGVATVVLCLGTQLASFAHTALVAHVRCAEHGELVHGDPGAPAGSPHGEGHDHCLLAAYQSAPLSVEIAAVPGTLPATRAADPAAALPAPPPSPIAICCYAPKHSPPV